MDPPMSFGAWCRFGDCMEWVYGSLLEEDEILL